MPLMLNAPAQNPYDIAGLTAQITARNQQARQAAAEAQMRSDQGLANSIGEAAKLYSTVQLKRADQELQDRRDRDARQERRALHDEDAYNQAVQNMMSTRQQTDQANIEREKLGLDWHPKAKEALDQDVAAIADVQEKVAKGTITRKEAADVLRQVQARYGGRQRTERSDAPFVPKIVNLDGGWTAVYADPLNPRKVTEVKPPGVNPQETETNRLIAEADRQAAQWSKDARDYANSTPDDRKRAAEKRDFFEAEAARLRGATAPRQPVLPPVPQQEFGGFDQQVADPYDSMLAGSMLNEPLPAEEASPTEPELDLPQTRTDSQGREWRRNGVHPNGEPKFDLVKDPTATKPADIRHEVNQRRTALRTERLGVITKLAGLDKTDPIEAAQAKVLEAERDKLDADLNEDSLWSVAEDNYQRSVRVTKPRRAGGDEATGTTEPAPLTFQGADTQPPQVREGFLPSDRMAVPGTVYSPQGTPLPMQSEYQRLRPYGAQTPAQATQPTIPARPAPQLGQAPTAAAQPTATEEKAMALKALAVAAGKKEVAKALDTYTRIGSKGPPAFGSKEAADFDKAVKVLVQNNALPQVVRKPKPQPVPDYQADFAPSW